MISIFPNLSFGINFPSVYDDVVISKPDDKVSTF